MAVNKEPKMGTFPVVLNVVNKVRANKGLSPLATLSSSMRLREELGFDSLDLAELTARLYEESGVDVFAQGLVITVGELEQRISDARKR